MSREKNNVFLYGGSFYPLKQKNHDKIFKQLKNCHINFVRTAEIFGSWDVIEAEKGCFNFDFLDQFFEDCQKNDIKILLGTGTASPPLWLHHEDENMNIVDAYGNQYPNHSSYSWACHDNPHFLSAAERYLEKLVNRYKDSPALMAYQIHNEPGYPFMPINGTVGDYCHCIHSQDSFRNWLKVKYNHDLNALNEAYQWGATSCVYTDWSQVETPKSRPSSWASTTHWLDFRLWAMENLNRFLLWQNDLIKKYDNQHPTSTNIFFLKSQDPLGVKTALDTYAVAQSVDIIGYDIYPGSGNKLEHMPEFSSLCLDHGKTMAKQAQNEAFWLLETEAGPINGWLKGPHNHTSGLDLKRNIFDAVGHGASLSLYQMFQEVPFQQLHWGGIIDLEANATERTAIAKEIGSFFQKHGKSLMNAQTPSAKVAILISKENAIIANGVDQETFLVDAIRGTYSVFWEMDYEVDIMTTDMVLEGKHEDYKIIAMPFLCTVSKALSKALAQWVEKGGGLIGTSRLGMLDEKGWYNSQIPCFDLRDHFGICAFDTYSDTHPDISFNKFDYKGHWHQDHIRILHDNVQVLARFFNDKPAVTLKENENGGFALFFGTHADVAWHKQNSSLYWQIIKPLLDKYHIKPTLSIDYSNRQSKEIDAHLLIGDRESWVFITHYINKKKKDFWNNQRKLCRLEIDLQNISQITDISSSQEIKFTTRNKHTHLELQLKAHDITILRIQH